jgi:phosphatidylserine decarboxylase
MFVGPSLAMCVAGGGVVLAGGPWGWLPAIVGFLAACGFVFFFRDPERTPPDDPDVLVATADGTVLSVARNADGLWQIDTFLSVFDVHVNRAPVTGTVTESTHHSGKFHIAYQPAAGTANERHDLVITGPCGEVRSAQIAGTLARRIVCRLRVGDTIGIGERIGLIRFGSRAQVVVPKGFAATVRAGAKVRAGESILARRGVATESADE